MASSLRYTFTDLAQGFEEESGIKVDLIYASSGKLTAQIENGAPYDIFISADLSYVNYLRERIEHASNMLTFAKGSMVVWSMNPLQGDLMQDLIHAERIAMANPDVAPFGRAAREVLAHLSIETDLQSRIVEGENIGQVNQFVSMEAVHIGFTSKSVVLAAHLVDQGYWYTIPDSLHQPLLQSALSLRDADDTASQSFMNYLSSDGARQILQDYGYKAL